MGARCLAVALFLLAACGGGGSNPVSGPVTPAPVARTDLFLGYYGGGEPSETWDHANLYMTPPWERLAWLHGTLAKAQLGGQRVLLGFLGAYEPNAEQTLAAEWQALKAAGLANNVIGIYPIDEPDVHGKSDAEVTAVNAMLRRVFGNLPIAVIYGCVTGKRPGLASYDWIGCDDYGVGCQAASGMTYTLLKASLRTDQRLILVPGGADPWRQDPACFAHKAHSDPQVVAILAFIWIDGRHGDEFGQGIRSNGMLKFYCETGRYIQNPTVEPTCAS